MPYTDKAKQAAATKRSNHLRKARWLNAHPCPCGSPSVTVIRRDPTKTPKVVWRLSEERIAVEVLALCEVCRVGSRRRMRLAAVPRGPRSPSRRRAALNVEAPVKAITPTRTTPVGLVTLLAEQARRNDWIAWRDERRTRLGYGIHQESNVG